MIGLRNLEKFYEGGYGRSYVLRRINLEIRQGEFLTIMGPSGAGKSTLLSILGMLDAAWTGEFEFFGHAVDRMKPKRTGRAEQEVHRVRVSELPPDRQPDGL